MIKAILVSFNNVVVKDDRVQQHLIEQLLIEENLRPDAAEYRPDCLGRSERACLATLLQRRGRFVTADYLNQLLSKKAKAYQAWLNTLDKPPLYPGFEDLLFRIKASPYKLALVASTQAAEVQAVLTKANLTDAFTVIVTDDDVDKSGGKPAPDGYQTAIAQLNAKEPTLALKPQDCVAIEDTFVGIEAAKAAGIPVIGVAHTYPYHMIQRCATWAVDYLTEIDFEWIEQRHGVTVSDSR
ncbi:MAG: HAD family phosphatase [Cyanobacteria bacterium P01_G01_bin.38]